MLSEHTLQGWMQGYTLTGRHALFPSYESFLGIVQTMIEVQTNPSNDVADEIVAIRQIRKDGLGDELARGRCRYDVYRDVVCETFPWNLH